jgi:hypothetical protein
VFFSLWFFSQLKLGLSYSNKADVDEPQNSQGHMWNTIVINFWYFHLKTFSWWKKDRLHGITLRREQPKPGREKSRKLPPSSYMGMLILWFGPLLVL